MLITVEDTEGNPTTVVLPDPPPRCPACDIRLTVTDLAGGMCLAGCGSLLDPRILL
jgi:hypothetical protein